MSELWDGQHWLPPVIGRGLLERCRRGDRSAPLSAGDTYTEDLCKRLLAEEELPASVRVVDYDPAEGGDWSPILGGLHGDPEMD